ncbi:response regulator [Dethiosulfatarculus sandiegensis]|nr:response regulator [Dethiosulfatarculus sandiegensis]
MISILFVDDEVMLLNSLRRMLRSKSSKWKMHFMDSGPKALELLKDEHIDIIVTDMRMPMMSGAELLKEVRKLYPHINRIILSGHADQEILIKSTQVAHQYIAKPIDSKKFIHILERAADFIGTLTNRGMISLVSKVESMPSPPENVQQVLNIINDETSSIKDVSEVVSKDMGMTSNLLKIVNSAFFGIPRRIAEAKDAIAFLGLDILKALVLSDHLFAVFDFKKLKGFSCSMLWEHCLQSAFIAKTLIKTHSEDQKEIDNTFIAGMLHDVGKLVLGYTLTEEFEKIIQISQAENRAIYKVEMERLGFTHAEVGTYFIGLWGMSQQLIEAIRFHHSPQSALETGDKVVIAILLADYFEHQFNVIHPDYDQPHIDMGLLDDLGLLDYFKNCQKIAEDYFTQNKEG